MNQPAGVDFRLLGTVAAVRDGEPVNLGGPRQRTLLALLLLEPGRPVPAEHLVEDLWHGRPPPRASATLHSYVSRLRKALGDAAEITGSGAAYRLDIPPDRVDLSRFEHLIEEGRRALDRGAVQRAAERLSTGLDLWKGRPYGELGHEGALALEAERLEELRVLGLRDRIEADLQLGAHDRLVGELETLVEEHPYREDFWRQLMLALYRSERQSEALAAYRRARAILDEKLGLEPGEELKQLEQAILRQDVPPVRPPETRHNLPAPLTSFVGRESELAEVERLVGETRLLTLTGVGGVGKTRLALEAAARALPDFPDGVYFLDFSPLADPSLVARHVATAVDVREQGETAIDELLVARLRDADMLLVLDNCEHLSAACAELAHRLLSGCPALRVLATSRELLGVPGEHDHPVPPLALPAAGAGPDELRTSEAVELFLTRARAARGELADRDAVLRAAADICSDLDGLPLAIELAAARTKALSLGDVQTRLSDRFRFLVSWRRVSTARHQTLRQAMDWSYELLASDERALLAHLSVFTGGFTLPAVAAVCFEGDEDRALQLLEHLVDASLVVAAEHDGAMRYRLLETVRLYAAERLGETDAATEARQAHLAYFTELVSAADLRGPAQAEWLRRFDAEVDNIRAALDAAAALGHAEAELQIVGLLGRYWWIRGQFAEGRARIRAALERGSDMPASLRANPLHRAAGLAMAQDDYASARSIAGEALEAARASSDVFAEVSAHNVIGCAAMGQQDYATAREHLSASLSLAERHGLADDVRTAKVNLGSAALFSGDAAAALHIFDELVVAAREANNLEVVGFAQLHLGLAAYELGDEKAARASWEEAATMFTKLGGFPYHVAHARQGLAALEARAGNHLTAARLLGSASVAFLRAGASAHDAFGSLVAVPAEAEARAVLGDEAFATAFREGEQAEAAAMRR